MSAEGDQQRRAGAPDDTDGKRRLRAVSYPDPYLVTKLPLEGTVNSGVIRLGEKMLLGFIHRPYPDGTRVRVVYDEWLFAERLPEPGGDIGGEGGGPTKPASGKPMTQGDEESGESAGGARKASGRSSTKSRAGKRSAESGAGKRTRSGTGKMSTKSGSAKRSSESDSGKRSGGSDSRPRSNERPQEVPDEARTSTGAGAPAGEAAPAEQNRFPEDFSDSERKSKEEIGGQEDAWTETFRRDDRED